MPRIQINKKSKKAIFIPNIQLPSYTFNGIHPPPKNKITPKVDIKIIWQYSAKKNKAKDILEYSTLNPDTNSDSPSVRSNGTLFVSAKAETKNIIATGNKGILYHIIFWDNTISIKFKEPTHKITEIIINPIETS